MFGELLRPYDRRGRQAFAEEKLSVWQQFMAEKQREAQTDRCASDSSHVNFLRSNSTCLVHVHWESVMVSWHSLLLVVHRFSSPQDYTQAAGSQIPSGIDVDVKYDVDYLF